MKIRAISDDKLSLIKKMYYQDLIGMPKIARNLGVSTDAVVSFMRRHSLIRRSFSEVQRIRFEQSIPSFTKKKLNTVQLREQAAVVAMLYWGEGYKGKDDNCMVDFANSDPHMIDLFIRSLRSLYVLNEKKFRGHIYCYSDQNPRKLIKFWSSLTRIPVSQFIKPYVRHDFKKDGKKMKYGLFHIRYADKKLLIDIKNLIEYYIRKYAPIV